MTLASLQPIRDPTRKPGTDTNCKARWLFLTVDFDHIVGFDFALTFDQKSKFSKRPILLSFSRRFQFWTSFLYLKLRNWSIGIFFIVVFSKAFFKASPSDLLMLIQPQAFIELPPWVWGRVLEIYIRHILAQCNMLKPSPTCTSSLRFSCLYIHMLGFIVT